MFCLEEKSGLHFYQKAKSTAVYQSFGVMNHVLGQ